MSKTNHQKGLSLEFADNLKPQEIVKIALEREDFDSMYVLYSGGKDSSVTLDFIRKQFPKQFKGAVFTNVGLGSQGTRQFVIDYCHRKDIPLFLTYPKEEHNFYHTALNKGFATKGSHRIWMGYLKYHSWYYFIRDYARKTKGQNPIYISGVRKKESKQRDQIKNYTREPIDKNATMTFARPMFFQNGVQLWDYFLENNLEKTPTYEWLNRSGECYCGAYTEPWDLQMMKTHDRFAFDTIQWMEEQIKLLGTEYAKRHWMWGEVKHSTEDIENQMTLDDYLILDDGVKLSLNDDLCGESCIVQ